MAKRLGVTEMTIGRWAREIGVLSRRRRAAELRQLHYSAIARRYLQGELPEELAAEIGLSGTTVRKWLAEEATAEIANRRYPEGGSPVVNPGPPGSSWGRGGLATIVPRSPTTMADSSAPNPRAVG